MGGTLPSPPPPVWKTLRVAFGKHDLHTMPRGLRISCKIFFFNIFSGELYFKAMFIEFFHICLTVSRRERERDRERKRERERERERERKDE